MPSACATRSFLLLFLLLLLIAGSLWRALDGAARQL
jgi:hypothetical protein